MNKLANLVRRVDKILWWTRWFVTYGGRASWKLLAPIYYRVCTVCHNLRPHGYQPGTDQSASLVVTGIKKDTLLKSQEHCKYCRLLCDVLDGFFVDDYYDWRLAERYGSNAKVGLMIRDGQPLLINCQQFIYDKYVLFTRVDLELYPDPSATITPAIGDATPCMGPVGLRDMDARSKESILFVQEVVNQCCAEHEACGQETGDFVPTRLLFVGHTDEDLRVCDEWQGQQNIAWTALSHCWGSEEPFPLQTNNLLSVRQHVEASQLPATFRDAITVTRLLSLQYIWIDCLCIIQDDRDDFNREAALMGQVYGFAKLVICAASSPKPSIPFLRPRDEEWACKTFSLGTTDGVKLPLMARRRHLLAADMEQGLMEPPFTSDWATLKREGPLYRRAWCWQETFVATRALHFAPGSIIFECKTHRRSQDSLPPYPNLAPGTLGPTSDMVQWQMMVKSYTSRQLTYGRDKLPAISGAARNMPQAGRTPYLAGLWYETLILDLLWQVMPGVAHQEVIYSKDHQSAPSWSWASVNAGVVWDPLVSPQLLAEVVAVDVLPLGADPYSQVASGYVGIRGRLIMCIFIANRGRGEYDVQYLRPGGEGSDKQHVRVDGRLNAPPLQNGSVPWLYRCRYTEGPQDSVIGAAWVLCLAKTPRSTYDHIGLLLAPSRTDSNCLTRVGKVTCLTRDWYENGTEFTVKIV